MRRIAAFTGTRAEYGLLAGLLRRLKDDPAIDLRLIVGAMHLAPEFGETWRAIEADGFTIDARVEMLLASDTPVGTAKSLGLGTLGLADALDRLNPDLLLLLGDRFEALAAAQTALILRIPIAHIHGGEISEGAFDDAIRHAISKMATWHFPAAEPFRQRLIRMGTPPDRVFTTGAPGLDGLVDGLVDGPRPPLSALGDIGLPPGQPFALATWHPATAADEDPVAGLTALLDALDARPDLAVLFTYPNADAGGRAIIAALAPWAQARAPRAVAVPSLGHARYRAALAHAALVIGNSSSGLIEAPAFGLPTVNIGDRQKGRLSAPSVLHCPAETPAILAALDRALSPAHRALSARAESPYGRGRAAEAIHAILRDRPIPRDLPFHDGDPA